MKAIFILFDSLAKNYLPPYGNDWVKAPNFKRLAEQSVTFDKLRTLMQENDAPEEQYERLGI